MTNTEIADWIAKKFIENKIDFICESVAPDINLGHSCGAALADFYIDAHEGALKALDGMSNK